MSAPHGVWLNLSFMKVAVPSFAKINLGLRIGALRPDGFHGLRTVYQTIALHDAITVSVERGSGIEIRCDDWRVPTDATNTCYKIVERTMRALKARGRVVVEIEKRLPVQGGLGGASGNAVAALLALERALRKRLGAADRLRIAAEVGSDLPLFLTGGTVLGVGRGEEVYPLPDLPAMPCVIALPQVAVSTPKAFAEWDKLWQNGVTRGSKEKQVPVRLLPAAPSVAQGRLSTRNHSRANDSASLGMTELKEKRPEKECGISKLTAPTQSDRMLQFSREISSWLSAASGHASRRRSGVSAKSGGRAENPLLDLVRTGIENDFEQVVFPQYPELPEVKRVLERARAIYASLSGSGSAVYGLFASRERAATAAKALDQRGTCAVVTSTLTRRQYWKKLQISD
jgi:4-diphosphocytidyl-2-C-methyl-D-erythritol kinase